MPRTMRPDRLARAALVAVGLLVLPAQALAQQPAKPVPQKPAIVADSIKLVFDREVYGYPGAGRRDPFTPLTGKNSMGPRFEELKLLGIIHSPDARLRSVATVEDGTGRRHKVRRGDMVGNVRIVDIGPRRVVVVVENFGQERQEILELTRKDQEGTSR